MYKRRKCIIGRIVLQSETMSCELLKKVVNICLICMQCSFANQKNIKVVFLIRWKRLQKNILEKREGNFWYLDHTVTIIGHIGQAVNK